MQHTGDTPVQSATLPRGPDVKSAVAFDAIAPHSASSAVDAFGAIAPHFDERYGGWGSVAAQRRAVRRELLRVFPAGSSLLELGGGTGEDALFMAERGYRVLVTDGSPAMLARAEQKAKAARLSERVLTRPVTLEQLEEFAATSGRFDGAFSNFAALNCVEDRTPVARGLARVLPAGAHALLVVFGPFCLGEVVVQLARRDVKAAFRRFSRDAVPARLGGRSFTVRYPSPRAVAHAFSPYFQLVRTRGIGVFVPPSAAEPAISGFSHVLRAVETLDRAVAGPLAWLGDHVLLDLQRTTAALPGSGT